MNLSQTVSMFLCTILASLIFLVVPFAHAQTEQKTLHIPITESFVAIPQDKQTYSGTGVSCPQGANCSIKSCRDLFRLIQTYPAEVGGKKLSQYEVFEQDSTYEAYNMCFVSGQSGIDIISNYLKLIYQWMAGIVGSVAVLMVVMGGVQIASGGGDQNNVNEGKTKIIQAISGLVVLFLSGLILYTINPTFFT